MGETGICLPDVSVYIELCNILGITINEFLAGEDIQIEEIEKKSESNLLYIIKDSKQIQKNFKKIIYLLSISLFAMIVIVGTAIYKQNAAKNYMEPLSKDSLEVKTAELLSGPEGAFLFRYHTTNPFKLLTFYVTEYQNGKLVSKREVGLMDYSDYESPKEGIIALVPQFDKGFIRLIEADNEVKYSTEIPILEREESSEYSGSAAVSIQDQENIHYNNEQSLIAFLYGKNGIPTLPIENIEAGEVDNFKNGYVYYFSVEFDKK